MITVRPGPRGGPRLLAVEAKDLGHAMKLQLHLREATYAEVADARVAVESFLARHAAERRDPSGVRALRHVLADIDSVDVSDGSAFTKVAAEFFAALRLMSGNQVLDLLGAVLAELIGSRTDALLKLTPAQRANVLARYRDIAAAAMEGDANAADELMRKCMRYWARSLQAAHAAVMAETLQWA